MQEKLEVLEIIRKVGAGTNQNYLSQLKDNFEQPDFWKLLGIKVETLEEGFAVLTIPLSKNFLNINNGVHGGIILSLLDCAMGVTLRSTLDSGIVTQSMTTQFLRSPKAEGTLFATGKILSKGRRIVSMEGNVTDEDGQLCAVSLATFVSLNNRTQVESGLQKSSAIPLQAHT